MDCKPLLTDEELTCFTELFTEPTAGQYAVDEMQHHLTVMTEVPQMVARILGQAKLTLLAEISHYKLWFPLTLKIDELGQFTPVLGIPEVLDSQVRDRSWRLTDLEDVAIVDDQKRQPLTVVSLSSSGVSIKVPSLAMAKKLLASKNVEMCLPDAEPLQLAFEAVRSENGILAAKINAEGQQREALRKFLFNRHRAKYSHLYQSLK